MALTIRPFFAGLLFAVALAGPAAAGPREDADAGFAADQKGDYVTAMKLYQAAALGGIVYAMHNIGVMYYEGKGVDRSYVVSMKWYRQAADKGFANSQHALGSMYHLGEGVKRDVAEAVKWYLLAANQGLVAAQNALGIIYTTGETGVPSNLVQAHLWFNLASKEDAMAKSRRDRAAAKMTPAQIAEAEKLAKSWKPK